MLLLIRCSSSGVGATAAVEGDDRVSGTDADRDENISHNGSSGFGGNADNSETADLRPFPAPIPVAGLPGLILVGGGLLSDSGRKPMRSRIANAKSLGWAIYAAGFAIWLFGYLSVGHAPLFDWNAATPWWVSSFVPNFEAELGLALMYASMIPIYGGAVRKRAFAYTALLVFGAVTLAWWWFLAWLFWNAI
jgi:hypothetical protein